MMKNPGASSTTTNPLANQNAPDQPQASATPLARIAPQMGGPMPMPAPTRAQTKAAVMRFSAVQAALKPVLADPSLGKENARPEVLDAGSKILAAKAMSLPELMQELSGFPDDPLKQKQWVTNAYNQAQQAEAHALDAHGAAIVAGKLPPNGGDEDYDAANHDQHLSGFLAHYKRA